MFPPVLGYFGILMSDHEGFFGDEMSLGEVPNTGQVFEGRVVGLFSVSTMVQILPWGLIVSAIFWIWCSVLLKHRM